MSTTRSSGEQRQPSRQAGCINRSTAKQCSVIHTSGGGGATRARCQRMSNKTTGRPGRLSILRWCAHGPAACIPVGGWPLAERAAPLPAASTVPLKGRGEPSPNTSMTWEKRGFFDLYTYRPCIEASATFLGQNTASTALKTIAGCRGGYREPEAFQVGSGHERPSAR